MLDYLITLRPQAAMLYVLAFAASLAFLLGLAVSALHWAYARPRTEDHFWEREPDGLRGVDEGERLERHRRRALRS